MSQYYVHAHFKHSHVDEWGREHVYCPVCEESFRRDAILKHVLRMTKLNDQEHIEWKKRYMEKISTGGLTVDEYSKEIGNGLEGAIPKEA